MLASASPPLAGARRARVPCRFCGKPVELSRMRTHLREVHDVSSADLETTFLEARKTARRAARATRR